VTAHILVVEDSELVTGAFRILLEESGYRVSDAATREEALSIAAREPVDLMLLDLTLPDGDGLEALSAMKSNGTQPGATLVMTGDAGADTRERCLAAGCSDVLVKPVSILELRRVLERHIG